MALDHQANLKRLFGAGLFLGLALSFWYQVNQIIDGDQLQMIHRGYLAAYQGIWSITGNTASVVGDVPGYLSTVVVALPLLLWDSPYAPIVFLMLIRLWGYLMIDAVIRQAVPGQMMPRLLLLVLLWLNPWVQFDSLLYNPAYLIFCSGLHLYSAWRLKDRRSVFWSFCHVMSIALAIQLHFSWPLLVVISLYLWWRQMIRVNAWGVALAVMLALLSLLPYLVQLFAAPEIAQHQDASARDRYIGWGAANVYPVLKSIIYWLRYGAWAFPSKLVNDAGFDWLSSSHFIEMTLIWAWRVLMWTLGGATLVIALLANVMLFRLVRGYWHRRDGAVVDPDRWLGLYSMAAFLATLVSAALAPLVFNYWHLILILPAALIPVWLWLLRILQPTMGSLFKPLLLAGVFLIAVNIVAINDSRKFSWQVSYADQVNAYVHQTFGPLAGDSD